MAAQAVRYNSYSLEPPWRGGSDARSLDCLRQRKNFPRCRKPYEISGFRNFDTRMRSRRDEMYLTGTAVLELLGEPRAQSVTTAACCFASARDAVGERRKKKWSRGRAARRRRRAGCPECQPWHARANARAPRGRARGIIPPAVRGRRKARCRARWNHTEKLDFAQKSRWGRSRPLPAPPGTIQTPQGRLGTAQ